VVKDVGGSGYTTDDGIARVSLVGAGIKSNPEVVADMFDALAAEGVNIEMISTSSIRISCVIRAGDKDRAVRCIHAKFGLGADAGATREHA
jgi:aspartate kinase